MPKRTGPKAGGETVRWNLTVSKDADRDLRAFLGARGLKNGGLAKFVEEAVRRDVLRCTLQNIWERNKDMDPEEVQRIVDEAVSEVRAERWAKH